MKESTKIKIARVLADILVYGAVIGAATLVVLPIALLIDLIIYLIIKS